MALDEATAALLARDAPDPAEAGHEMTPAEAREHRPRPRAQRGRRAGDGRGRRTPGSRRRAASSRCACCVPTEQPAGRDRVLPRRRLGAGQHRGLRRCSAGAWPSAPGARWCWSATGWRRSTGTRPRSRTAGPRCAGSTEHMAEIAGARVPLIVAGDSAGGNLAAVMARRAAQGRRPADRAAGARLPRHRLRLRHAPSYTDPANQLLLTARGDGLVLGPLRPGRRGPAAPRRLAAAGARPVRPAARRRHHRRARRAAGRGRAVRHPADEGRRCRCGTAGSTGRCTASSPWSACCPAATRPSTTSPTPSPSSSASTGRAHVPA